jgi:hypothetical protein
MITDLVSYDDNTFGSDYEVGFVKASEPRLAPASVQTLERVGAWPVVVALQRNRQAFALLIRIVGSDYDALRTQLFQWFDPDDEDPKTLVAENHDGVEMSIECLCEELRVYGDLRHDNVFVATLVVSGDVYWRATTATTDSWSITASGDTHTINNSGELEVYPVYTIEPTTAKGSDYEYRRWVPITWLSENAGSQYPLRAELDTATLVSAGKMQADGDDLRVQADGSQVDRWLDSMNSGATAIWFNLDFQRAPDLSLTTAIASSGTIASIELDDEVEMALLPETGIVLIDSEAFLYTAKNLIDKQLTGITRATKGTSMAAHTVGDDVHWIQHDVYILYGNGSASAPSVDDDYKPAFELDHSSNTSWVYEQFGDGDNKRAGRWQGWGAIRRLLGNSGRYTGDRGELADPYTYLGAYVDAGLSEAAGWYLAHPCGIVNAAWSDGEKYYDGIGFNSKVRYWPRGESFWKTQYDIPEPSADTTWESWSKAADAVDWDPVADQVAMITYFDPQRVQVGDVTVSLNSSETPVVSVNGEQGNYDLSCTLTNQETGEAIDLDFVMDVNSELEIDTDERVITWLADDSRHLEARTLSSVRRHWLRLLSGNNTLEFTDVGTGNVTITTEFKRRYY